MYYKKVFISGLLLLVSFLFTALGCKQNSSKQNEQTGESILLTAKPEEYDTSFAEIQEIAKEKALAWRSDAKLVYVTTEIQGNLNPGSIKHTFVYDSSTLTYYHYLVTVAAQSKSFIRALIPKEDYLGSDFQQILPLYWKINYIAALQKCDLNGGSDFRSQNGTSFKIELNLMRKLGENQKWVCSYSNLKGDSPTEITVDASNGQVSS